MPGIKRGPRLMPWFKVDDTLPFHAKIVMAGNPALGLWVRAGAWSSQQLTDGFIPEHIANTLGKKSEARRLVAVGLWREVCSPEQGYVMHDYLDSNPSRADVEKERPEARERMKRVRARSGEVRANEGRSSGEVRDARPDPSRTSSGSSERARPRGRSTTDERVQAGLDLAAKYDQMDAEEPALRALPGGAS